MCLYVSIVHSLLLLGSVPLCGYTTLFIHSSIDAHWSFQFQAIKNKIAVNIHIQVLYGHLLSFLLSKHMR